MLQTPAKDPVKQRAGRAAADARWGKGRRVVRLHELTDAQRQLVVAMVEAAKAHAQAEHDRAAGDSDE